MPDILAYLLTGDYLGLLLAILTEIIRLLVA